MSQRSDRVGHLVQDQLGADVSLAVDSTPLAGAECSVSLRIDFACEFKVPAAAPDDMVRQLAVLAYERLSSFTERHFKAHAPSPVLLRSTPRAVVRDTE